MGGSIGKKLKKLDPLRGGDVLLEKAGLPTFTGEGDKNIMGALSPQAGGSSELKTFTPAGTPTVDEARMSAEQADLLRRRRGRASTVLTSQSGDTSTVNVGTKTLLGG